MIVLIVTPVGYTNRGQVFDGTIDGRAVVTRSTQPLLDAARMLVAEGVQPSTRIVMRHVGRPHDAVRSTVEEAAKLTVADDGVGKLTFRSWRPHPMWQNP